MDLSVHDEQTYSVIVFLHLLWVGEKIISTVGLIIASYDDDPIVYLNYDWQMLSRDELATASHDTLVLLEVVIAIVFFDNDLLFDEEIEIVSHDQVVHLSVEDEIIE